MVIEWDKLIKKHLSELIRILRIYMLHSFTASDQVTLQVTSLLDKFIASRTVKSLEECTDIVYVTNMTTLLYQLNILLVLLKALSCKFPKHCAVSKFDVIFEIIDTYYLFHRWNINLANSLELGKVRVCSVDKKEMEYLWCFFFECKWRASTPKMQRLSLYDFLCSVRK